MIRQPIVCSAPLTRFTGRTQSSRAPISAYRAKVNCRNGFSVPVFAGRGAWRSNTLKPRLGHSTWAVRPSCYAALRNLDTERADRRATPAGANVVAGRCSHGVLSRRPGCQAATRSRSGHSKSRRRSRFRSTVCRVLFTDALSVDGQPKRRSPQRARTNSLPKGMVVEPLPSANRRIASRCRTSLSLSLPTFAADDVQRYEKALTGSPRVFASPAMAPRQFLSVNLEKCYMKRNKQGLEKSPADTAGTLRGSATRPARV